MKTRLLSTLALISLFALAMASPAAAQKPIPGIKSTAQYGALKSYVQVLFSKRNVPAGPAMRAGFKERLSSKRIAANQKSKQLLAQRTNRLSKQDDDKQNRQIRKIRQNQKAQVSSLKTSLSARLAALQSDENAAVDRVNARYASRINPLVSKRRVLQRKLARTTNPLQQAGLKVKIAVVQKRLNVLVDSRQSDINVAVTKYNSRSSDLSDRFAARIKNVKASASRQITQARLAWKRIFSEELANAKEKQKTEVDLITALSDRGSGYIAGMPAA